MNVLLTSKTRTSYCIITVLFVAFTILMLLLLEIK